MRTLLTIALRLIAALIYWPRAAQAVVPAGRRVDVPLGLTRSAVSLLGAVMLVGTLAAGAPASARADVLPSVFHVPSVFHPIPIDTNVPIPAGGHTNDLPIPTGGQAPTINVRTEKNQLGGYIYVSGHGFTPSSTIDLYVDGLVVFRGQPTQLASITTSNDGSFPEQFVKDARCSPGQWDPATVRAVDRVTGRSATDSTRAYSCG